MKKQFEISIDHSMMAGAKAAFDACMKAAIDKAISTKSNEGTAALKISFDIVDTLDKETGEWKKMTIMKYKAGFSVPMKESVDAKIPGVNCLVPDKKGYLLVNNQINMDELLQEDESE